MLLATVQSGQPADFKIVHKRGLTSLYRPWRKSATVPFARYPGAWRRKPTPRDLVCAHRWLPFWTVLRITNPRNGKEATCVVLDRGPYGACVPEPGAVKGRCPKGYRYKVIVKRRNRDLPRGGYYRGVIDATPRVHKMMESPGWIWTKVERRVGKKRPNIERFLPASVPST